MIPVAKPRRARRSRRKTVRLGRRRRPAEMKGSANTSRWRSPAGLYLCWLPSRLSACCARRPIEHPLRSPPCLRSSC